MQTILLKEFARAIGNATQTQRCRGGVMKMILFESYARKNWVGEPENG